MIRFGVIGTNWITERFLDAAKEVSDFTLTAVYSRTTDRAKEFAHKFDAPHTFTNLEEMAKSDWIDAVYIASPNSFHRAQAILFMENGKHVICEKPLASNQHEVKEMFQCAEDNQVLLMEAMKTTFIPSFQIIQEHLHKIGPIRRYFANFCQYSSRYDAYKNGKVLNAFDPAFSNGALMDIGIYCLYPLVVLFGKPNSIKASGTMLKSGVDGQGSIIMQYDDMEASIMYSKITQSFIPNEIQGEKGNIVIDKISSPSKVIIEYRDGTTEDLSQTQKENTMYYELKEFIDLIQRRQFSSTINSYENSLITSEIIDEARKQIGIIYPSDRQI